MIFELSIPDEIYNQYGSQQAIYKRIVDTADLQEEMDWNVLLTSQQTADLRRHFGKFTTAEQLEQKIMNVGVIKLEGEPLQLDADQIRMLKDQAFGNAREGEPRSEQEAKKYPKKVTKNMIQRYIREHVLYSLNQILGLV